MALAIETVSGDEIRPWLPALARLRMRIFRDWPYLYEGSEEYENRYLEKYASAREGIVVLALAGGQVVGAATGLPLRNADEQFHAALDVPGAPPMNETFYFGESVLREDFRGQGIGHSFFEERERFASAHGYGVCAFCAVQRPDDHPLKPVSYRSLEGFWRRRGYERISGAVTHYAWTDIGESRQTEKPMQLWSRRL